MPIFTKHLPLSLYIHLPWCVKKCPYCDFNSHVTQDSLPETLYLSALIQDLDQHLHLIKKRPLVSIFFGGGTPSLFSAKSIAYLLDQISKRIALSPSIEITLEANPGTFEQTRFRDYKEAHINRLSLGIQSFQDDKLKVLGRIHDSHHAKCAIKIAQDVGFSNINLDLMYGLPDQSLAESLSDIEEALSFKPTHLSWYQLTIEPNTLFHHQPPILPSDDAIWEMQTHGQTLISQYAFTQYEVSAYALAQKECIHNRNYWEFGDYLGIGAGAHSKITNLENNTVMRFAQVKNPRDYMDTTKRIDQIKILHSSDLIFEFMLNALRLTQGISFSLFTERTGLDIKQINPLLNIARERGLLNNSTTHLMPSELGKRFLNDVLSIFLT